MEDLLTRRPLIMLVEDQLLILLSTAEALDCAGFSIVQAGSAAEAIQILHEPRFDLSALFVDIDLKAEMTGFDVARAGRRRFPKLGVVYASGASPINFEGQRVPGGRFVEKPYSALQVAQILRDSIAKSSQRSLAD